MIRVRNKISLLISILLIALPLISSCSDQVSPDNSSSDTSNLSNPVFSQPIESGTLRLWTQNTGSFDPRSTNSLQWKSMTYLFYESLYKADADQKITSLLAENHTISDNGKIHTISLKKDVKFNDGEDLKSQDIVNSYLKIKESGEDSPYHKQLVNIIDIKVSGEYEIVVLLKTPDPFLEYKLTFPVPSQNNYIEEPEIPVGSGPYEIVSVNEDGIRAVLNDAKKGKWYINNIYIYFLEDTKEAMGLFGEDGLESVILDDQMYMKYYFRTDIDMNRYPGRSYMFFQLNMSKGSPLSDRNRSDHIKNVVSSGSLLGDLNERAIVGSPFPFVLTSGLLHRYKCEHQVSFDPDVQAFSGLKTRLKICYVYDENDIIKEQLIHDFGSILESNGIINTIIPLSGEEMDEALRNNEFDIALREAVTNNDPDPSWLYLSEERPLYDNSDTIRQGQPEGYTGMINRFKDIYYDPLGQADADTYCRIMNEMLYEGPFIGIGFRVNALITGKRIRGDMRSDSTDPYNNLKDVWVWLG